MTAAPLTAAECALLAELNDNLLVLVEEGDGRESKLEAELTRAREAIQAARSQLRSLPASATAVAVDETLRAALGEEPADGDTERD